MEGVRRLTAGGVDWNVVDRGTGPALLLLHGTGASHHSWDGAATLLEKRHRLIIPDLPLHGASRGRPRLGPTLDGMAEALGALLRELGAPRPRVVGHSAGAAIACRMTIAGTVSGPVVGFGPALLPMGGSAAPLFGSMARMLLLNPLATHLVTSVARQPGSVGRFLERATGSTLDADGVAAYQRLFADPAHVRGTIEMMSRWRLEGLERALPHLPVPLAIVHGEKDRAINSAEGRKAARLAKGSFELLPGLGHLAHEERPDLAAALIERLAR